MAAGRRPRVLVIDDDPGVRQVVSYLLAEFGFECHTAEDGASGLGRFDEGGWDLVVTDLAMPKLNGWQVIEAIRHRTPMTPIVLVTAYTAPEIVRRAGEYGVPVVAKPFPIATLQAAIAEALDLKSST
jgi:CheY-like chemotaxis protein